MLHDITERSSVKRGTNNLQMIKLDPSSPWGYEIKHGASHKLGQYHNAVVALEVMLLKMAESPDPVIQRELYMCYRHYDD